MVSFLEELLVWNIAKLKFSQKNMFVCMFETLSVRGLLSPVFLCMWCEEISRWPTTLWMKLISFRETDCCYKRCCEFTGVHAQHKQSLFIYLFINWDPLVGPGPFIENHCYNKNLKYTVILPYHSHSWPILAESVFFFIFLFFGVTTFQNKVIDPYVLLHTEGENLNCDQTVFHNIGILFCCCGSKPSKINFLAYLSRTSILERHLSVHIIDLQTQGT